MMGFNSSSLPSPVAAVVFSLLAVLTPAVLPASALPSQATPPATAPTAPGSQTKLTGRPWKLISLNGHDLDAKVPKAPQMTLLEDGTRILGFSGCNRFLGTYSLHQDRLSVNGRLVTTNRVCRLAMEVERDFLQAMQSIDSWKIVNGVLELSRQKQILARFE